MRFGAALATILITALPTSALAGPSQPLGAPPSGAAVSLKKGGGTAERPTKTARRRKRRHKRRGGRLPALRTRLGRYWLFYAPITASLSAEYASRWRERPGAGAIMAISAQVEPSLRYQRGKALISVPLSVRHRQTPGLNVNETGLGLGLRLSGRPIRALELGARADTRWVLRRDWPDLFQPVLGEDGEPSGALALTDRYGFQQLGATAHLDWRISAWASLSLRGGFDRRTYEIDPSYDGVLSPTHLVPADRDRFFVRLRHRGKLFDGVWRYGLSVRLDDLDYAYLFARDAKTGLTHAIPGGAASNPLQRMWRLTTRLRTSVWLKRWRTRVLASVGYRQQVDTFAGYYSYGAIRARLGLRVRPARGLRVSANWSAEFRRYGADSYQEGQEHPALDGGDARRRLVRHRLGLEISYRLWKRRLQPFLGAQWAQSQTNFPDYSPFVFPSTAAYDIGFDWSAVRVGGGLRLSL